MTTVTSRAYYLMWHMCSLVICWVCSTCTSSKLVTSSHKESLPCEFDLEADPTLEVTQKYEQTSRLPNLSILLIRLGCSDYFVTTFLDWSLVVQDIMGDVLLVVGTYSSFFYICILVKKFAGKYCWPGPTLDDYSFLWGHGTHRGKISTFLN